MLNCERLPDPALSCALAEVLRLKTENAELRAYNARLMRFAADQQRAAENCGHNLEAAEQDVETLREALETVREWLPWLPAEVKQKVSAALAATAPEGEGR